MVAACDVEVFHHPRLGHLRHLPIDQCAEIVVVHKLFLVANLLETAEDVVDLLVGQLETKVPEAHAHRGAAAVLGQRQLGLAPADFLRIHDLVRLAFLDDAVLVNAAGVGEGVLADDRLAALHRQAAHPGDQLGGLHDLLRHHAAGVTAVNVVARLERHDDLLERGVAGSFADAVDGALDLPRSGLDGGERVGHGHAKVIVTMHADDRLAGLKLRHGAVQVRDQFAELPRHGPADGVGDVHRRRAGIDGRLADLDEEIRLGAGSILRRKLDVGDEFAGALHAIDGELDDLALCLAEFELAVQLGRGEEDMDASLFAGRRDGLAGRLNVPWHTAGEAGDGRSLDFPGDGVDGGEVALADHREAALDHVHLQPGELPRDLEFLAQRHRGAGALLAVAEGRVKNDDPVFFHIVVSRFGGSTKNPVASWQRG